ncbi:MAG: PTS fructose transporter subunit IIA [Atopobiaceae bacterium]|jgi:PTS system N-acetylgalactosamine-specific IIA component|nr:PTS fructose transporter subunit IIA [Atopobiaceae bacterium]MCH4214730.1 PTS fructose transporter subunit IIA [Atopobiaceae bacterium]MCH4229155.1 PTS fructose transporter subunit IIA [Atopobiaceae bacterium]MCH4276526.1 PTS fructose transporter subunit IIA [Atopobiaceae bacterium]MCI1225954.1 PTS fructose transporter subunit IIA [Atopobiaceae bacterium]
MRYLLMVSHGTLAPGLHSVLKMLSGSCDGVLSCSMEDGMGADDFVCRLEGTIAPITSADEVLVLGDIIGGSPLTNTLDTLARHGLLAKAVAFGGMNLPMALTALMGLQTAELDALRAEMLSEGRDAIREVDLAATEDDEDDEDDI